MKTVINQTFHYGFQLTEQELRRLVDQLVEQVKQTAPNTNLNVIFEIKFKNGAISKPDNVNEIVGLENAGSQEIVRLIFSVDSDMDNQENETEAKSERHLIAVNIINPDEEPFFNFSIGYRIESDRKDWALITKSVLDERLRRIRRFSLTYLLETSRKRVLVLAAALFTLVAIGIILFFDYFVPRPSKLELDNYIRASNEYLSALQEATESERLSKLEAIDKLESKWMSKELTEAVPILLETQRLFLRPSPTSNLKSPRFSLNLERELTHDLLKLVTVVLIVLAAYLLYVIWTYFNRPYNFLWGDYVKVFEKRRKVTGFVFGSILLAVVLGVLVEFLSAQLGIGR